MENKVPILLVNSLNIDWGSVTKSVLTYANLLVKKCKKVYICTLLSQARFKRIINIMYQKGLLDKRIIVLNMFESLKPHKNYKVITHNIKEKNYIKFKAKTKENFGFRYFKDSLYEKYKLFNEEGDLLFVDYMNNSRHRCLREEYSSTG